LWRLADAPDQARMCCQQHRLANYSTYISDRPYKAPTTLIIARRVLAPVVASAPTTAFKAGDRVSMLARSAPDATDRV